MKITMYELLGMVKDGKAPKTIKSEGHYYNYNEMEKDYYEGMGYDYYEYLFKNTPNDRLNDEVEILEEKKIPEKLSSLSASDILDIIGTKYTKTQDKALQNLFEHIRNQDKKINEIIDYLKSKGE